VSAGADGDISLFLYVSARYADPQFVSAVLRLNEFLSPMLVNPGQEERREGRAGRRTGMHLFLQGHGWK